MKSKLTGLLVGALVLAGCSTVPTRPGGKSVDLLIRGGTVYDGMSEAPQVLDVAVVGDRIVLVGRGTGLTARRVIDASNLVVAPGFIDPHTHLDSDLASSDPAVRFLSSQLMQGVTTVVVGNDGEGQANVGERLAAVGRQGAGVNVATFVGFGAVRRSVVGEDARSPTSTELLRMRGLVAQAMCEGALGFSAGLYYAPQSFSETDEVVALAREAASRGGIYETHLRDEGSGTFGLLPAVDEALNIARSASLPLHIAHIKALGVEAHGQSSAVIRRVEAARAAGLRVTADQYPWTASGTTVAAAFFPGWALDGGLKALQNRVLDPALRTRLEATVAENIRRRGGPGAALVTSGRHRGKRLDAIAGNWTISPAAAALRIIADEGDASLASFNMDEADIRAFRARSWVVTGSDAVAGHPRKFGSFARAWQLYVRDSRLLTPGAFIRRSSGLTAELLGLEERGRLLEGSFADITIFDPRSFSTEANFEEPTRHARGVHTVVVNGQVVVDRGRPTGLLAGRGLAKSRQARWSCPE